MQIIVSGASGLIGSSLTEHLRAAGHQVTRLVRPASGTSSATSSSGANGTAPWNPTRGELDPAVIDGADAVINLSGAGIGDHRWTDEYRAELVASRTLTTGLLARTIASVDRRPSVFLSGSAIGWYGARGDEVLDERSQPGTGFLADLCRQWEAETAPAAEAGVRTVQLRTGIVLTPQGGALKKQLPLFKLGLGGRFGSGRPWQSWIDLGDEVGAIEHLLTADVSGPVNLTAPEAVTGREFAAALGRVLHRPAFLPIPSFGPKLLLGADLANALLFTGQRVAPTKLTASGYQFRFTSLEPALRAMLGR